MGLVLVAALSAPTAAPMAAPAVTPAQPPPMQLISSWSPADMKGIVVGMGLSLGREARLDNGDPLLVVKAANGAGFVVQGAACTGAGATSRCQGANLVAFVPYETPAKAQAALARLTYPAVTVSLDDPKSLALSRYLVLDEGISRKNLEANIRLFLAILDEARSLQ